MNSKAFLVVMFVFLLSGCTKSSTQEDTTETHLVTFNVNTFDVVYEPISRAANTSEALGNKISEIRYIVFRNGSKFSQGTQSYAETPTTFGTITVAMPSGISDIHFIGIGAGEGSAHFDTEIIAQKTQWGIYSDLTEVFYNATKGISINTETIYPIELSRKTGLITLNITDAANAPISFGGLQIELTYYDAWFFNDFTYQKSQITRTFQGSSTDFPIIQFNTWPSMNNSMKLHVLDKDMNITKTKIITYDVYANRKTIITGELFGGNQDFTVTINDEWDADNITEFQ